MTVRQFLALDEVLGIHDDQIRRWGGRPGIRDLGLLESAIAMPQASAGGELAHPTCFEQAAAYLFHLVKNHAFVDGNKRVGLATALAFLALNDFWIVATEEELVDLVLGVAEGRASKSQVGAFLQEHAAAASRVR